MKLIIQITSVVSRGIITSKHSGIINIHNVIIIRNISNPHSLQFIRDFHIHWIISKNIVMLHTKTTAIFEFSGLEKTELLVE